jgi:hypothetical protein
MYKLLALPFIAILATSLTACAPDNVGACEDWVASMSCGDNDFGSLVDCSLYEETTCDIASYFDCLTENTTCDEKTGVIDTTGWAGCMDKATCD